MREKLEEFRLKDYRDRGKISKSLYGLTNSSLSDLGHIQEPFPIVIHYNNFLGIRKQMQMHGVFKNVKWDRTKRVVEADLEWGQILRLAESVYIDKICVRR